MVNPMSNNDEATLEGANEKRMESKTSYIDEYSWTRAIRIANGWIYAMVMSVHVLTLRCIWGLIWIGRILRCLVDVEVTAGFSDFEKRLFYS